MEAIFWAVGLERLVRRAGNTSLEYFVDSEYAQHEANKTLYTSGMCYREFIKRGSLLRREHARANRAGLSTVPRSTYIGAYTPGSLERHGLIQYEIINETPYRFFAGLLSQPDNKPQIESLSLHFPDRVRCQALRLLM
jgi:hypothetical protein